MLMRNLALKLSWLIKYSPHTIRLELKNKHRI